MDRKKIIFIKEIMTQPRYHFDRTIELAKYYDVEWIIGWKLREDDIYPESQEGHIIHILNTGKPRKKLLGVWDQFKFAVKASRYIRNKKSDLIIVHSNRMNFVFPVLLNFNKLVMQTFTPAVNVSKIKRFFWDHYRKFGFIGYKRFFVDLKTKIDAFGLNRKKSYIVHWGLNPISTKPKQFDSVRMIYIGTLSGRNIHQTIYGLREFINTNPESQVESYDIIGTGQEKYIQLIEKAIRETGLSEIVKYHGYLSDEDIVQYFDTANLGIAYVPITEYFTNCAVTKTSEYLLSGIPVIATATNWNKKIINDSNGVLIQDNAHSFCTGLELIAKRLPSYSFDIIMKSAEKESISYNIKNELVPTLNQIIDEIESK